MSNITVPGKKPTLLSQGSKTLSHLALTPANLGKQIMATRNLLRGVA